MKLLRQKLNRGRISLKVIFIYGLAFLMINSFVGLILPARADKIGSASDMVARLETNTVADHQIKFQTKTGVDSNTDTITLTFDSGFDISSIVLGDVDLSHGAITGLETEENVGNSAGADRWGFQSLGQVVTFTPPTDAVPGEIVADEYVVIKLGTNATGGTNKITNPSSAAVVSVDIAGAFGDVGAVYIPIITSDEVVVSATVMAAGEENEEEEGGGSAGPQPKDETAPVISNVRIEDINSNSAMVIWETDEYSVGTVEYGINTNYGNVVEDVNNLYLSHQYKLFPLEQDTEYYFKLIVRDQIGNETVSSGLRFKTPAVANVINFRAEGFDSEVLLNWQYPNVDNIAGVRILRREDGYAETQEDGLIIFEGNREQYWDRDVINNKWYFYTVFIFDTTRQYSSGAISEAVALKQGEVAPPKPDEVDKDKYEEIMEGLEFFDLEFWVANQSLRVYPDENKNVNVLSESLMSIVLPKEKVTKQLKTIIAQIGDSNYLLKIRQFKDKYQSLVSTPKQAGDYPIVVLIIVYQDGTKDTVKGTLVIEDYGIVKGMPVAKLGEVKAGFYSDKVQGVKVTLFTKIFNHLNTEAQISEHSLSQDEWEEWNGARYFQYNPQMTDKNGEYGYMVPNGNYYIALEKDGYEKSVTPVFQVKDNIINWDLHLDRVMKKKWYMQIGWWFVIGILILFIIWWKRKRKKETEEEERKRLEKQVV